MPTLSNHPIHHLDFTTLRELPDTHAWPRTDDQYPPADEPVPLIDLHDPDLVPRLSHACRTWGVFYLVNHGVPSQLLALVESECRRLFSLSAERKLKALRPPGGLSGYGVARISTFFSKLMWSEGFTIVESPADHAAKLWPDDHQTFCEVMEEYKKETKKVAERLMVLILTSLGQSGGNPVGPDAMAVLQLNSYPACPEPDRAMGLAAHTDSSLLTILHQSSTSGLQVVHTKEDEMGGSGAPGWVTVPPQPGALVVHVGDLLQILSNGRYRSVLHRAVVNKTRHRVSMAYIYGPQAQVEIGPLEGLVGPGVGPLYRAVTWREYLGLKAKHFDKALSLVRVEEEGGGET